MEILGVHHVAKVVKSIEAELKTLKELGFEVQETIERDEEQKVKVGKASKGDFLIELLEPLGPESPIANAVPGLNHLCLKVKNIEETMKYLKEHNLGFPLTKTTISVFEGRKVAFFGNAKKEIYELIEWKDE